MDVPGRSALDHDADGLTGDEPDQFVFQAGVDDAFMGEFGFLLEMLPAFPVGGNEAAHLHELSGLYGFRHGEREVAVADQGRETRPANMEDGGIDDIAGSNFFDAREENRISGNIERARLLPFPFQYKTDHMACYLMQLCVGAMLTGGGGDAEARYFHRGDRGGLPVVDTDNGVQSQSLSGLRGGDDLWHGMEEFAPGIVEIVLMLVMAKQYQVDGTQFFRPDGRGLNFL